jgi:hypothetical protein
MSTEHTVENDAPLTEAEHAAIRKAAELWNALCSAIPDGPTRAADLGELVAHVHAIQHAVMANAAARAYPDLYRPLGGTLRVTPPGATS